MGVIKVSLNFEDIAGAVKENLEPAKQATLKKIKEDTEPYIPYKTGKLNANVSLSSSPSAINYDTDYASFAFDPVSASGKPKNYTKVVHPQAQGEPFDASSMKNAKSWVEYFRKELIKNV